MMNRAAAVLVLTLGVSADVPAWVQQKPSLHMPSLESFLAKMKQHVSNGRRLQAVMSDGCKSACPGAMDFVTEMMKNPPKEDATQAEQMKSYCPNVDTLVCIGTTAACQDSGKVNPDEDPSGLHCFCSCQGLMSLVGENPDVSAMCKGDTFSCLKATSSCEGTRKSMGGTAVLDVNCKMLSSGCMDGKGGGKMEKVPTCPTYAAWNAAGCDAAAKDKTLSSKAETCCPASKGLVSCATKECIDLSAASAQLQADKNPEQAAEANKLYEIGKACPDSGMPASKDEIQNIIDGASGNGAAADSTTPVAGSLFVMVAAVVALVA